MISSLVTPCAKITPENWAVTMVKDLGSLHARILFEGIEDFGEQFVQMAHLTGAKFWEGRVQCFFSHRIGRIEMLRKWGKHEFKLSHYSTKTTTWILSRDKVESLMKKIEGESGKGHPFFIAGKTSFLAKSAETYDIHNPLLSMIADKNEKLFLKLYDSYCNEKKTTGMKEEEFNVAIRETLREHHVDLLSKFKRLSKEHEEILKQIQSEDINHSYQCLMGLFEQERVVAKETEEDNCFTWAKLQFKYLGIELKEPKSFQRVAILASVTSLQVFHPIKADGEHLVIDMIKDDSPMASAASMPKPLSHRTVTHKKDRDKRTEAFKSLNKETRGIFIKNTMGVSSLVAGSIISVVGFWGGVGAACGVVATAPVSVPMTIGAAVLAYSGRIVSDFQSSNLDRLKKEIIVREITAQEVEKLRKNIQYNVFFN